MSIYLRLASVLVIALAGAWAVWDAAKRQKRINDLCKANDLAAAENHERLMRMIDRLRVRP